MSQLHRCFHRVSDNNLITSISTSEYGPGSHTKGGLTTLYLVAIKYYSKNEINYKYYECVKSEQFLLYHGTAESAE